MNLLTSKNNEKETIHNIHYKKSIVKTQTKNNLQDKTVILSQDPTLTLHIWQKDFSPLFIKRETWRQRNLWQIMMNIMSSLG